MDRQHLEQATNQAEMTEAQLVRFAAEQAMHKVHGPNAGLVRELEIGEGVLLTLSGANGVAIGELHAADERAIKEAKAALDQYVELVEQPESPFTVTTLSYSGPNQQPLNAVVEKPTKATVEAVKWVQLMISGIGEQPAINPVDLASADALLDRGEQDPDLMQTLIYVGAEAMAREAIREWGEFAKGSAHDDSVAQGIMDKMQEAIATLREHPLLHNSALHSVLGAAGTLGHAGMTKIPFANIAISHAERIYGGLSEREQAAVRFMAERTDDFLTTILGTDEFAKGADPVEYVLYGMKMTVGDKDVIPDTITSLGALAKAIGARAALRYADRVFDSKSTGYTRQIGLFAGIAAATDLCEKGSASSLHAAEAQ